MNTSYTRTKLWLALGILMTVAMMAGSIAAQGDNAATPSLEGSWTVQTTFRNCDTGEAIRSFPAMNTFMQGGTLLEFGLGNVPLNRSPGQGVWSRVSGQNYNSAFQFFRFNADATPNGTIRVRRSITLTNFGTEYIAISRIQFLDNAGAPAPPFTACATEAGVRFQ